MRFCTFNVHMWADARGRSNTQAVIDLLRSLDCDVVALNEVTGESAQLARAARELGMHHAYADAALLGNALLSRGPLRDVVIYPLAVPEAELRSALVATVDAPGGPIDVCSTHLDSRDEPARLAQLDALLDAAAGRLGPRHLVMGDFNAIRPSDYAPAHLARIAAQRAAAHREPPLGDVIARMDALGYVDGFRLARAGGPSGYAAELARPVPEPDLPTCWAGTRIDFVWASPALARTAPVRSCGPVASAASDHVPVLLDLDA